MELNPGAKLRQILRKYRHALLVLLVGLGLMLLPSGSGGTTAQTPEPIVSPSTEDDLEARLESILGQISGAGEVMVLLTVKTGQEQLYQTDEQSNTSGDSASHQSSTILVEDGNRQETGLVRRVDPPTYQGALIVCQGGDNPSVKLAIVEAVRCVTGLGADQITVVKMK